MTETTDRNRPSTAPQRWQMLIFVCALLFLLGTMVATVYAVTSILFRWFGLQPAALITQIINTLLGVILFGLVIGTIGRVYRPRQWQDRIGVFAPIIEAMQRIAKGDFSVQIDDQHGDNQLISELTKNVNNMAAELNQLERMRQEFISNVSHELQSPLTSIRGFAQALQNEHVSDEDRKRYLTIIETESMRLSKLTDNLLKLASLEVSQLKVEPTTYRLDKQIRRLILACEPQWTAKAIELDVALEEATITADEDLLSQVWINLIHNSIKFTPQGGSITINLQRQDDKLVFAIRDSGIGISAEDQEHIFERFYKADKSRTRTDSSGSGLGLSIAHKIIEIHQGCISVASTPNAGTTFAVSLPEN
ncbi:MAG: two-component sensor histidine kinase [Anaerolineae bacterium]|nr:two-component sensor histidine kinase [Anaerolineae bacterium]